LREEAYRSIHFLSSDSALPSYKSRHLADVKHPPANFPEISSLCKNALLASPHAYQTMDGFCVRSVRFSRVQALSFGILQDGKFTAGNHPSAKLSGVTLHLRVGERGLGESRHCGVQQPEQ
jgi:hypothetical protein